MDLKVHVILLTCMHQVRAKLEKTVDKVKLQNETRATSDFTTLV